MSHRSFTPIVFLTSIRTSFPRCVPTDDDEFEVAEIKKDEPKKASTFDDEEEEEEPVTPPHGRKRAPGPPFARDFIPPPRF